MYNSYKHKKLKLLKTEELTVYKILLICCAFVGLDNKLWSLFKMFSADWKLLIAATIENCLHKVGTVPED
jgi:hypothetical protein